jgi:CheY-like chemotaxis protein
MPRMDGAELARRIRESRPEMPVLIITGYTGIKDSALDLPQLAKPFGQAEIATALADLTGDKQVIPFPKRGSTNLKS